MNLNIKKYVPFMLVLVAILILSGTSYALLKSTSKGSNPYVMNVGVLEISFQDSEQDKLTLVNQIPINDEEGIASEEEYEFTIKNTGTLPATYSVYIEETSNNPEFKSVIRYIISKNNQEYGVAKTLSEDKYIDTNAILGIDVTATYKVKLWLSIDADSTYMNKTFTARIVVDTTLNYDGFSTDTEKLVEDNVVNYSTASASDFEGGLVAINTDGGLYNENDTTQSVREYRYSGVNVDNYIYFNCKDTDGTYLYGNDNYDYANNCELWRIIGVFTEDGEQVIKIMRNTSLSSEELPETYIYDGTTYQIEDSPGDYTEARAYWNKSSTTIDWTIDFNDWTTAGLQYFLNKEQDESNPPVLGYYSQLSNNSKILIRSTTYYLGNFNVEYSDNGYTSDTTINGYYNERRNVICDASLEYESQKYNCNVWSGNKATWNGKIGLLYPSDYGYSADDSYWIETTIYDYKKEAANTSWIYKTANFTAFDWVISPGTAHNHGVLGLYGGIIDYHTQFASGTVRPVTYLISSAKIIKGTGENSSPYVVLAN